MTGVYRHSKPATNRLGSILTIVIAIAVNGGALAKTRPINQQKDVLDLRPDCESHLQGDRFTFPDVRELVRPNNYMDWKSNVFK